MGETVVLTESQIIHDFGLEIARLRAENERLRSALQEITAETCVHHDCHAERQHRQVAREALNHAQS